jgi:chromosome segregation ATPase
MAPAQSRAVSFLKARAAQTGSAFLSSLAVRAAEDPFAKVKKMIKDLLVKLLEQANEEADHKGWCDSELAANKKSRDDLSAEVETLTSKVDELTALIAKLSEEIPALADEIAEIDAAVAKATKDRAEEKATNEATIADAKTAQTAVQSALTMLKEFYVSAAESTAFLQGKQKGRGRGRQDPVTDSPSTWDTPFKGMQGSKDGILGMLEVVQSDFARLEADTSTSEAEAAREFLQFTDDSAVDKAVKDKEMRHKQYKKDGSERFLRMNKETLEATQKELTAALDYYDKLKPTCIETGLSYEARVKAREEELQSLKEALRILNGEDLVR